MKTDYPRVPFVMLLRRFELRVLIIFLYRAGLARQIREDYGTFGKMFVVFFCFIKKNIYVTDYGPRVRVL